jgi:hypothetical protein
MILVCLMPNGLSLGLNTALSTKNCYASVKNSKRSLNFNSKVDVAGSVDNVDGVAVPLARNGGRLNRDSALALLDHEVGRGIAVMDIAVLVDLAGIEKNALGSGGFTCVDMRNNSDVAYVG